VGQVFQPARFNSRSRRPQKLNHSSNQSFPFGQDEKIITPSRKDAKESDPSLIHPASQVLLRTVIAQFRSDFLSFASLRLCVIEDSRGFASPSVGHFCTAKFNFAERAKGQEGRN
jgi:hypothetical protein